MMARDDATRPESPSMSEDVATCIHCLTCLEGAEAGPFCCTGCRFVYGLLHANHLERFYALRAGEGRPVSSLAVERRDYRWLEPLEARLRDTPGLGRVDIDVQGLHCSGCVWLIETIFRRHAGAKQIVVNPTVGRVHIVADEHFGLRDFVCDIERFGYLFGPALKSDRSASRGLLIRMAICIAIAMNAMLFAIAIYSGLSEGPLFVLFGRLVLVLGFASVAIGGSVFIKAAWHGLRRGVLHLDLPIALGIVLAFAGSVYSFALHGRAAFFDTLTVFIALMLVGRFLQQRILERNRLALLASDGVDGLIARRVRDGTVASIKCTEIRAGDTLLVAPGELVPVDGTLRAAGQSVGDYPCDGASFSLDWINGESRPRVFPGGARIPAGAFHAGSEAVELEASTAFEESPLIDLLRTPLSREAAEPRGTRFWQRFAKIYVLAVLGAAALGFGTWIAMGASVTRAIEVATAVLIVTCPCAFGIAQPLAFDLVQAGLRRAGLCVRSPDFLDRAPAVRNVVFDKTGTLTSGTLAIKNATALAALAHVEQAALAQLVARSHHPKSLAVKRALGEAAQAYDPSARVVERAGLGLELTDAGRCFRLGAPEWAAPGAAHEGDVAFAVDGAMRADLLTVEDRRADAAREVQALQVRGYEVWLLSGDTQPRVDEEARACGIPLDHAIGGKTAKEKSDWVTSHDRDDLLMVGDGINDSLVVGQAFCSGTPAIDRPFMAARSDFYFVSAGLRPIRLALDASHALARVRRRNLRIAVAYNVLAVTLAYAGVMSPLVCAVLMPVSSLTTILATTLSLSPRRALWKS